jgi:D-arginine dehydrogenase
MATGGPPWMRWRRSSRGSDIRLARVDRAALESVVPGLRRGWDQGLSEPSCADIDVAGLHAFYLKAARAAGARLVTDARLVEAERSGSGWRLSTSAGQFEAEVLANAAGAWADEVARAAGARPLGIRPYRRTMAQLRVDPPAASDLPLVIDALGRFYFKPEAGGRIWLSPHDETACEPCDSAPEEEDVRALHPLAGAGGQLARGTGRAPLGRPAQLRARSAPGLRFRRTGPVLVRRPRRLRHPNRSGSCRAGCRPAAQAQT